MMTALIYALLGVTPYFLDDLASIIWTRRGVGIAEAAVMTCSYAPIGAYYSGKARERWYALALSIQTRLEFVAADCRLCSDCPAQ